MIEDFVRLVLSPFRDQNSSGTSDPSGLISLDAASAKTPANRPDSALIAIIASGPTRTAGRTPRSFARLRHRFETQWLMAEVAIPRQMFQEISAADRGTTAATTTRASMKRSIVTRSSAIDRRNASRCQ